MEIDHWKFPRQGIPLAMKPCLPVTVYLPTTLPFSVSCHSYLFLFCLCPSDKCCCIQREGFVAFFWFVMPVGLVPTT